MPVLGQGRNRVDVLSAEMQKLKEMSVEEKEVNTTEP
jgi:hypothetical protein